MSCSNCSPCSPCEPVTATNEPLPSALENFIFHFFGTVTKTVVNGKVQWTLPCNLAVGLPSNPRNTNEGVACYLLRLIENGILGLKGDKGDKGDKGQDGKNGYTFVAINFNTPDASCPTTQIQVVDGSIIPIGTYLFIQGAGWFEVTAVTGNNVAISLIQLITGAVSVVSAGSLVLVTGPKGPMGNTGPKGDTGATGATGATGTPGATGAPGAAASTTLTSGYTQPAVGSTVVVSVADSSFFVSGQQVYVVNGGYYEIQSLGGGSLTLINLTADSVNVPPTTAVPNGSKVFTTGFGPIAPIVDVVGSGADYALTGSFAKVDFGGTDIDVVLPMAGTYLVSFNFQIESGSPSTDLVTFKMRNVTAGADINGSTRDSTMSASAQRKPMIIEGLVTVAAAATIELWGMRGTNTASVISTRSSSRYMRVAPVS